MRGREGQAACSACPQAGALGGALACKPRCVRIFSITGCSTSKNKVSAPASEWHYVTTFYADTLKRFNPVPMVVNALMDIQGLQPYRESIFLVVTELFVNSLEHGLLSLDSALKHSPDGFAKYFELRQSRLEQLEQGRIKLIFRHQPDGDGGELTIRIQDTGSGFDYLQANSDLDSNDTFSGRGLKLIRQICDSLEYSNEGRQATAVFRWNNGD